MFCTCIAGTITDIQAPGADRLRFNLGPWFENTTYRTRKGQAHNTSYRCFMRWRSKCTRELRLVQYAGNISLQGSGVHSHQQETPHRLSVGTLTSIHEAVHHHVTQFSTEIRRTVSREETHLTVKHHRKLFANSPFWMSGNGVLWETMKSGWRASTASRNSLRQMNHTALHMRS